MRSLPDRLHHAVSFELIALLLIVPLGTFAFHLPVHDIGTVALAGATIATFWNMVYNLGFDHVLASLTGSTRKSGALRLLHAVLFEAGLLLVLMPFIAWHLGVTLWQALVMDLAFALFYMAYAFVFNWAYDRLFPVPDRQSARRA